MMESLHGAAAGSGAPSSAAVPVWEPSPGPLDLDPVPGAQPAVDPAIDPPATTTSPVRPIPVRRSRSVPALLSLAAVVAVAGLCFTIGRVSAPSQTTPAGQNGSLNGLPGANASGAPGDFGGGLPGGDRGAGVGGPASVSGTVVSISASSMTIQLADGQTVQVATGSSTTYHNQTAATSSDVAAGDTVEVQVSGGNDGPNAASSASASASGNTRTATDVTVTGP